MNNVLICRNKKPLHRYVNIFMNNSESNHLNFLKLSPMIKKTLKPLLFCTVIVASCASFIYINSVGITQVSADVELSIDLPSEESTVEIPVTSIAKKIAVAAKHFLFPMR